MRMFSICKNLRSLCTVCVSRYNINCVRPVECKTKFHTVKEVQYFPVLEIKNMKPDQVKCDEEKWDKIVEEVLQAVEEGKNYPQFLCMRNIEDLVECISKNQRSRYLLFLFKKERKKAADKEKKQKRQEENSKRPICKLDTGTGHIEYGLGKNTLVLAVRQHTLRALANQRLANAVLFGQKMVIDLSYDGYMCKKERRDCSAQLRLLHGINRQHCDPLDLYYCNANSESRVVQYLLEEMPVINEPLVNLTEQSYLDIFPKENLVYLSPHAPETLTTYDHKAVYIIGAFVDTVKRAHISLHKAQSEGIKTYSLPIDKYVLWGQGSRSLSINQVFSIMLTMRDTGDWSEAFKHIPTRKLKRIDGNERVDEQKLCIIRN